MDVPQDTRWNHNIHYQPVLLDAINADTRAALDVGCGEGILTRRLAERLRHVVGIDLDADQIALAQSFDSPPTPAIEYVRGDVMTYEFGRQFDAVLAVAMVHHIASLDTALTRLGELVAPGGVLAISGLGKSRGPTDFAHDAAGAVLTRTLKRTGGRRYYFHSAPILPPKESYAEVRRRSAVLLPGVRYRRRALFRYTLVWRKPTD